MAWEARSGLKPEIMSVVSVSRLKVGMAWEARSGLKPNRCQPIVDAGVVGMAWEARSGLKHYILTTAWL